MATPPDTCQNATEAAEALGIDLTLIEESLRLTPQERAVQHQAALEMALQLQTAYHARVVRDADDRAQSSAADAVRR